MTRRDRAAHLVPSYRNLRDRSRKMISICNLRNDRIVNNYDIRIDRASVLGNPYFMRGESKRDEVCDRYEAWFNENKDKKEVKIELDRLITIYIQYGKLRLFCWCAPKRCHGETIKDYIIKKGTL